MFDGTTATFEKLRRPDTVVVFPVLDDGRILLTEQEQPGKEPFIGATGRRLHFRLEFSPMVDKNP